MIVFSIDPPNAWSDMSEHKVDNHGRIPLRNAAGLQRWRWRWIDLLAGFNGSPDLIAIEGVHHREHGADTPQSRIAKQRGSLVLARRAGIIEGLCAARWPGTEIVIVPSSDWRKTSGLKESMGRAALKPAAVALVKQFYRITVSHDEADAILIGRHGAIAFGVGTSGLR